MIESEYKSYKMDRIGNTITVYKGENNLANFSAEDVQKLLSEPSPSEFQFHSTLIRQLREDTETMAKKVLEQQDEIRRLKNTAADSKSVEDRIATVVRLFNDNKEAIEKIHEDLQAMPGGYRNSQDIKRLVARFEALSSTNGSVHGELSQRIERLETTIGNVMEKSDSIEIKMFKYDELLRRGVDNCSVRRGEVADFSKKIAALEECCKNTVASGKVLEGRVDSIAGFVRDHATRISFVEDKFQALKKL